MGHVEAGEFAGVGEAEGRDLVGVGKAQGKDLLLEAGGGGLAGACGGGETGDTSDSGGGGNGGGDRREGVGTGKGSTFYLLRGGRAVVPSVKPAKERRLANGTGGCW